MNTVDGLAYEVKTVEMEKLIAYETDMYRLRSCWIQFEDGTGVLGRTFIWNADPSLLTEGKFDLKDWQMKQLEFSGFY